MSDKLDPHTLEALADAWYKGRNSVELAPYALTAGPKVQSMCNNDLAPIIQRFSADRYPSALLTTALPMPPTQAEVESDRKTDWVLRQVDLWFIGKAEIATNALVSDLKYEVSRLRADVARLTAERDTLTRQLDARMETDMGESS